MKFVYDFIKNSIESRLKNDDEIIWELLSYKYYNGQLCNKQLEPITYNDQDILKYRNLIKSTGNNTVKLFSSFYLRTYYFHNTDAESKKDFEKIIPKKEIYNGYISNNSFNFINMYISWLHEYKKKLPSSRFSLLFKFSKEKNQDLIDNFIINDDLLEKVILLDNNIEQHINNYIDYFVTASTYMDIKITIWQELVNSKLLTKNNIKKILISLIDMANQLISQMEKKNDGIRLISQVSTFIQDINAIKNLGMNLINDKSLFMKNIDFILRFVTYKKRVLLSNNEYLNSTMHPLTFEIPIKKKERDKYVQLFLKNIDLGIVRSILFDLDKNIKDALKNIALVDMTTNFTIDSNKGTYHKAIISFQQEVFNYINQYINDENTGNIVYKKIFKNDRFFDRSTYVIFLKDIESNILNHINSIYNLSQYPNNYSFIVSRIIEVEIIIDEIFDEFFENYTNLKAPNKVLFLFKKFKCDKYITNMCFTLYLCLYDENNYNIRNRFMHGDALIEKDLNYYIYIIYGLVYITRMLQDRIKHKNEGKR